MLFGVPNRRLSSEKLEKYPNTGVITLPPFKGKGTSRSIVFNKEAIRLLGLDLEDQVSAAQVSFSFDTMAEEVFVANTTGQTGVSEVKVSKTSMSASDKKYFEAIKRHFSSDMNDELELILVNSGTIHNDNPVFSLNIIHEVNEIKVSPENCTEKLDAMPEEDAINEEDAIDELLFREEEPVVGDINEEESLPDLVPVDQEEEEDDPFSGL